MPTIWDLANLSHSVVSQLANIMEQSLRHIERPQLANPSGYRHRYRLDSQLETDARRLLSSEEIIEITMNELRLYKFGPSHEPVDFPSLTTI